MAMDGMPPRAAVLEMIWGYVTSQAIFAVAQLGVADQLAGGARTVDEVAAATGADARSLERLLRLLSARGVFTETEAGTFALTPLGQVLRSDAPGSLRAVAQMAGSEHFRAFAGVEESARTGKPAFDAIFGAPFFDHLSGRPESNRTFDQAMATLMGAGRELATTYDLSGARVVVDVGGGEGRLLASILKANPSLRGMVVDGASTVERARKLLASEGLAERGEAVAGDFFAAVPGGGDVYILSRILHDWDDERCVAILRNCRAAMGAGGRLLVVEQVIHAGDHWPVGRLQDVIMLVVTGGRERTEAEYARLFEAAGLELVSLNFLPSMTGVLEARPR